jgi:hypothetical protein
MSNTESPVANNELPKIDTAPIEKPLSIWKDFMLPMLVTVSVVFAILFGLQAAHLDCATSHLSNALLIAFACAMAGGILGGGAGIVFDFPSFKKLGARIAFSAVGGFAAFVIGFPLAYFFLPKCSNWSSSIRIDAIKLNPPEDDDKRPAFVAVSISSNDDGANLPPYWKLFSNASDASISLDVPPDGIKLIFTGFTIVKPDPNAKNPSIQYQYLGTCVVYIKFASQSAASEEVTDSSGVTYRPFKTEQFNPDQQLNLNFVGSCKRQDPVAIEHIALC